MAASQLLDCLGDLAQASGGQVASLRATVGAVINATLAISRTPPEKLLDDLLREFLKRGGGAEGAETIKDQEVGEGSVSGVSAFIVAAMLLLEKEGTTNDQLHRLITTVCLPALSPREKLPVATQAEIASSLGALISARGAWELAGGSLIPACKAALTEAPSAANVTQSELFKAEKADGGPGHRADFSDGLAPLAACHLASNLVQAALRTFKSPEHSNGPSKAHDGGFSLGSKEESKSAGAFLAESVSAMLPVAFAMLTDGDSPMRRRQAVSILLPSLLEASLQIKDQESDTSALGAKLWACCEKLLEGERGEKADGFSVIACFKAHLLPPRGAKGAASGAVIDVRGQPTFWEAIKNGLLDEDSLIRRQALQVLRLALPTPSDGATSAETGPWVERGADGPASTSARGPIQKKGEKGGGSLNKGGGSRSKNEVRKEWKEFYHSRKRDGYAEKEMASMMENKGDNGEGDAARWDAFLLLYENLDDYTLHLFEATWPAQMEVLHSGDHLPQPSASGSPPGPDFSWVSLLWQRGFQHRNPQVRQAVLTSFFDRQWDGDTWLSQIPQQFVLGPLWKALDDPVQHPAFGSRGVWASPITLRASDFFLSFVSALPAPHRLPFLCELTRVSLAGVVSRPGLLTLASCLVAASEPLAVSNPKRSSSAPENPLVVPADAPEQLQTEEALDRLRAVVQESRRFHNPGFRLAVCGKALEAAAGAAKPPGFTISALAKLLAAFPDDLLSPKGALRDDFVTWVAPALPPSGAAAERFSSWLSPGLALALEAFFQPTSGAALPSNKASLMPAVQDEGSTVGGAGSANETRGWEQEAQQWAAFLALELLPSGDVAALLEILEHRALDIYRRPYLPPGQAEKTFLVLRSLAATCPPDAPPRGSPKAQHPPPSSNGPHSNGASPRGTTLACHVANVLGACMDELTAYAGKASAVLWEGAGMLAGIPGAPTTNSGVGPLGRGTLVFGGGPRALTGNAATTVTRAVLSVTCVSECCIWLQQQNPSPHPESATNFLLAFLWHFVAFLRAHQALPATAAEAELWAAILEALSAVCRAAAAVSAAEARSKGRAALVVVTEEHYEQPVEGFTRALAVVADDVADDVSRAAANVLEFPSLPRGMRGTVSEHKWLCLDALLATCAAQPPPPPSAKPSPPKASRPSSPPKSARPSSPPKEPRPFLTEGQLLDVLDDISDGLESAAETYLTPMLRCTRFLIEMGMLRVAAQRKGLSETEVLQPLVESAWAATADLRKRRVSVTSSVLATFLHPSLFSRPEMHGSGEDPGPLRWLLTQMLQLGQKSPRTIRLAALQVCELWLRHPDIARLYVSEAVRMALHGSDAVDEELDEMLSEGQPAGGNYAALLQSRDPELTEVFHNSELYVRVSVAVMVHEMARLCTASETQPDVAERYRTFGQALLMDLLTLSARDADVSKNLYKKGSIAHRKKVRTWQMLCVLSPFLERADVAELQPLLAAAIQVQNMSSVRQYVEQFAVQVYLRFPHLVKDSLVPWLNDVNTRTQTAASLVMIAAHVVLHSSPGLVQQDMLRLLFPATLPYLTSHHHNLRTFTQVLVHRILTRFGPSLLGTSENEYLTRIAAYLEHNIDCHRVRVSVDRAWAQFDPQTSVTPRGIFCPSASLDDALSELPFECVPGALYDRVSFFIKEQRDALRAETAADMSALDVESAARSDRPSRSGDSADVAADVAADDEEEQGARAPRDYQRKIKGDMGALLPPETDLDEDVMLAFAEARTRALLDLRGNRQDLIVVASLVARIPNLAGLARTCEVFKAAALVVADKSVVDDRQFQLISVSADKWVPLLEVPESGLAAYLQRKQREGYSLVGLEQTANSVPLHTHRFPRKTVLVLGREKEGIPADLIHHLDACVEIPQLGVIRSLNVHVSGAIATWEYSRSQFQSS
ncbi:hypothetical protein KFL_007680030 [Klebsormidium nitens]|uniref:tRNA (guanosine(18)-2'-O)-methyltransferase TARBP1 n=1 Tax=Klebsormidium nitens TaxID=105231 RepID=A0A1Y1IRH0_KLENI|nr:hypothetical protein KFL_007680030 [Klebsormidium nitens]|eukprot:GAQ91336.1 hypothetical protein KFL_007680030 [Klebsormidium nitens]